MRRAPLVALPRPWQAQGRDRQTWFLVGALAVAGLVLRLLVVFVAHPTCPPATNEADCWSQGGDPFYFAAQADALADGNLFVSPADLTRGVPAAEAGPGAAHPPVYTVVLGVAALAGVDTPTGFRAWTALFGALTVVALATLAWRLAGRRAAVVAAVLAAVVPGLWLNDVVSMSEGVYALLLAGVLHAAFTWWARPGPTAAVALGGLIGLAALTRAEAALLVPFLALPLAIVGRGPGERAPVPALLTVASAALLVVAPWVGWNLLRFDEPTLLTTSTGITVLSGSCEATYEGRALGNYHATCSEALYAEQANLRRAGDDVGDESVVDARARRLGLDYVGEHLDRVPVVMLFRVGRTFGFIEPDRAVTTGTLTEQRWEPGVRAGQLAYFLMVPTTVAGLLLVRRRGITIVPFVAFAGAVVVLAALTSGLVRFRTPIEVVAVVLTSITVVAVQDTWRARRAPAPD